MKVINLFAGAGAGKSTVASGLFYYLKNNRLAKCELVNEYAKDLVYDESFVELADQLLVTANQNHRLIKLEKAGVELAIADSPLILGIFYYTPNKHIPKNLFEELLVSTFNSYDNINIFLERDPNITYETYGRKETYEEAVQKDKEIKIFLDKYNIPYVSIKRSDDTIKEIIQILEKN